MGWTSIGRCPLRPPVRQARTGDPTAEADPAIRFRAWPSVGTTYRHWQFHIDPLLIRVNIRKVSENIFLAFLNLLRVFVHSCEIEKRLVSGLRDGIWFRTKSRSHEGKRRGIGPGIPAPDMGILFIIGFVDANDPLPEIFSETGRIGVETISRRARLSSEVPARNGRCQGGLGRFGKSYLQMVSITGARIRRAWEDV